MKRDSDMEKRRLLIVAAALGENITELWKVYNALYGVLDMDDPDNMMMMLDLLGEFEENLTDVLNDIGDHIHDLTGVFEPLPLDEVDDFEASVLRSIENLGSIDLDSYRMELE